MYKGKNGIANKVIRDMEGGNTPEISQVTKPQTTVWVNGCFDVIHAGHIELLKYARSVGDRLVVGLDTDERVRESKGIDRPINSIMHRKAVMEAIRYVDEVVEFGTDDALKNAIQWSSAKFIVVGAEYEGRVIGSEFVEEVKYFDRLFDLSTTNIVSR
jgi:D-beta-D-heptose 7-phosphate kinase/D-beta-D-heptose 1-phosphate adenosyltransferase